MFFEGLLLFATIFFGVSNLKYERVHYALLFHFCTSLWNLMVIPETYLTHVGYYLFEPVVTVPVGVHMLYIIHIMYHLGSLLYHNRPSLVLKLHHILTILLLVLSGVTSYQPLGCVILLLNDISDLPMYCLRHARAGQGDPDAMSEASQWLQRGHKYLFQLYFVVSLILTLLSWLFMRIIAMYHILGLTQIVAQKYWSCWVAHHALQGLYVMNVYWYGCILCKLYGMMTTTIPA